jgi:hypothetical protein
MGRRWWKMKGGDVTKELYINNIASRISDYGHKRCGNNESMEDTRYFKENYELYFIKEKDAWGRMLEDGWTKGDFNKGGIGNVAYFFKFTSLLLFLLIIHDGLFMKQRKSFVFCY